MRYVSIAKDFYYETSASTLSYYITCNGRTVYSGVSVKPSDSPVNRISIRQRVADYLDIDMPDFRDYDGVVIPHPEQLRDFELYSSDGTLLETYRALLGYYDEWDGSDVVQSDPVNGHTDPRQKIFYGTVEDIPTDIDIEGEDPYEPTPDTGSSDYLTFEFLEEGSFRIGVYMSSQDQTRAIEYSRDSGETWTQGIYGFVYGGGTTPPLELSVSEGDSILVRHTLIHPYDWSYWPTMNTSFGMGSAKFNVKGAISSVYDSNSYNTIIYFLESSCVDASGLNLEQHRNCYRMFYNCVDLVVPPFSLSDGTQGEVAYDGYEYKEMFRGCESMESTPSVYPETAEYLESDAFQDMYSGCTSLVKAYTVNTMLTPNSGSYVFRRMFNGCVSLKKGPDFLTEYATHNAFNGTFIGCTSLTTAGEINVKYVEVAEGGGLYTDGAFSCMFSGCTALVTPPSVLPATQSYVHTSSGTIYYENLPRYAYAKMFSGCSSLIKSPILPATYFEDCDRQYYYMFEGCSSLVSIICYLKRTRYSPTVDDIPTMGWVDGVSANGTLTRARGSNILNGVDGNNRVPSGWNVVDKDV